eukprot:365844-Chlamydomonas_euryale.AAC.3
MASRFGQNSGGPGKSASSCLKPASICPTSTGTPRCLPAVSVSSCSIRCRRRAPQSIELGTTPPPVLELAPPALRLLLVLMVLMAVLLVLPSSVLVFRATSPFMPKLASCSTLRVEQPVPVSRVWPCIPRPAALPALPEHRPPVAGRPLPLPCARADALRAGAADARMGCTEEAGWVADGTRHAGALRPNGSPPGQFNAARIATRTTIPTAWIFVRGDAGGMRGGCVVGRMPCRSAQTEDACNTASVRRRWLSVAHLPASPYLPRASRLHACTMRASLWSGGLRCCHADAAASACRLAALRCSDCFSDVAGLGRHRDSRE